MSGLRCMNGSCRKEVAPDTGKLFAQVFVCPDCFQMAEHFYTKMEAELRYLLTVAKESIRIALLDGKMIFPEGNPSELSKQQVLEAIVRLEESRHAKEPRCDPTPTTPSSASSSPPALTPAAPGEGSSPKGSPPDSE